jgi:hypothetical protein
MALLEKIRDYSGRCFQRNFLKREKACRVIQCNLCSIVLTCQQWTNDNETLHEGRATLAHLFHIMVSICSQRVSVILIC